MAANAEHPTWGGKRAGQGRPKGAANKGTELGRKTLFASTTISGAPEEIAAIKALAAQSGKSTSRYIIETLLQK